jgi:hypothetical protein
MERTHDDEKPQTIETRQRSGLAQLGQTDPSGETESAGAIGDAQPGIKSLDQQWVSRR